MANGLQQEATRIAASYGIPVKLFLGLVSVESGWNTHAVSPVGAQGLTQLMPKTASGLGVDPADPVQNLEGGARYLRTQYDRFKSWPLALAAYNAGPNAVASHGGIPSYSSAYVKTIMAGIKVPRTIPTPSSAPSLAESSPALDFGQVGMENLSTGANPLQSLENLTTFVHANGGPGAQGPLGEPLAPPARASRLGPAGGFLLPGASFKVGRKDQGQDFQTDPGAAIVAPGAGVVVAVKSDPHGFGPSYPVVRFTGGPYAGEEVYIGHTISAVRPGQRFSAGQVISHTGTSPIGNAAVPGWAEIGFARGGVPGVFGQSTPFKA